MATVFATKSFEHNGRGVVPGDALEATAMEALRLKGEGKVSLSFRSSRRLRASTPSGSGRQADIPSPSATQATPQESIVWDMPHVVADELHVHQNNDLVDAMGSGEAHALSADNQSAPTRRRRGRRSYRRAEADVDETTELDPE